MSMNLRKSDIACRLGGEDSRSFFRIPPSRIQFSAWSGSAPSSSRSRCGGGQYFGDDDHVCRHCWIAELLTARGVRAADIALSRPSVAAGSGSSCMSPLEIERQRRSDARAPTLAVSERGQSQSRGAGLNRTRGRMSP
jgi:hypothetical protein